MEIMKLVGVRVALYLSTFVVLLAFVLSVRKEPRRMLDCVLLVCFFILLWTSIIVVAWYRWLLDISGLAFMPLVVLCTLFVIFLTCNGFVVIRKEGFSLAHALPLLSAVVIVFLVAIFVWFISFLNASGIENNMALVPFVEACFSVVLGLISYLPLMVLGFMLYSWIYQHLPKQRDVDFIVVLGCGLNGDKVTPLLASRLEAGMHYRETYSPRATFLVSGGRGRDESVSEAAAMRDYLIERGVSPSDILIEDESTTTWENLRFSKPIMERANPSYACVCVTNNFHVFRSALFARNVGINGQAVGAKTAGYYLPTALIREYAALILSYRKVFVAYAFLVVLHAAGQLLFFLP